jgi:hypothetical protein
VEHDGARRRKRREGRARRQEKEESPPLKIALRRAAATLLALLPLAAGALDRGHFKGMPDEDLAPLAAAFEGVQVHYLVGEKTGGAVLSRMVRANPKVNGLTDYGLFMYFNARDAELARDIFEKTSHEKVRVQSGSAAKVVREQFARRNAEPSRGDNEPDDVIFISVERKVDAIEYLATKGEVVPMSIKGVEGKRTVLAFLSRAKAIEVQEGLKQGGVIAERVGLDEKSFLRFILEQAKQGRAVQVVGF